MCLQGFIFDNKLLKCNCPNTEPLLNASGNCIKCDPPKVWNAETKICKECQSPQVYSEKLKDCACPDSAPEFLNGRCQKCPSDAPIWNGHKCAACPPNSYADLSSLSCIFCPEGFSYD